MCDVRYFLYKFFFRFINRRENINSMLELEGRKKINLCYYYFFGDRHLVMTNDYFYWGKNTAVSIR